MRQNGSFIILCHILLFSFFGYGFSFGASSTVLSSPSGKRYTKINPNGTTIIPNGRLLTPMGKQIRVAPHPYGLVLSPDGKTLVTANSGTYPFSLSIIRNIDSNEQAVQQIAESGRKGEGDLETVFMGLAITPDNKTVYASSGGGGEIMIFDLESARRKDVISLNGRFADGEYKDGYLGDLVLNRAGSLLFVVDQANFRMVIVDPVQKQVLSNVPVGRYPFGIAFSPDETKAYVANVGMFEYSPIKGVDLKNIDETTLTFPPFGVPSQEAMEGTVAEGKQVPGLGDPNAPESFSVWTIDVSSPQHAKVVAKTKTGHLVGEKLEDFPAVGGSSPNSIVATADYVYVTNGNNDCVTVIDANKNAVIKNIDLYLNEDLKNLRGLIPFGL